MRDWQVRLWKNILHVVGSAFVKGACTPSLSLETWGSARIAIPTDVTKEMKSVLRK
jgi:hypothetical protein